MTAKSSVTERGGINRRDVLAGAVGLGLSMTSIGAVTAETPRRGGNLRVAILGGGSSDTLDANYNLSQPDAARVLCLYQPLRRVRHGNRFDDLLAESMESNRDATVWTIRLRKDITFHDGKPLKAEDVVHHAPPDHRPEVAAPRRAGTRTHGPR